MTYGTGPGFCEECGFTLQKQLNGSVYCDDCHRRKFKRGKPFKPDPNDTRHWCEECGVLMPDDNKNVYCPECVVKLYGSVSQGPEYKAAHMKDYRAKKKEEANMKNYAKYIHKKNRGEIPFEEDYADNKIY